MLTLRFERTARAVPSDEGTFFVAAPSFRTEHRDGQVEVEVLNEDRQIVETCSVGHDLGCYDCLYVMNAAGATVARFLPPLPVAAGMTATEYRARAA